MRARFVATFAALALLLTALVPVASVAQPDTGGKGVAPRRDRLVFHKVGRGDVVVSITERGTLEAAVSTPIKCLLRSITPGSKAASTIKTLAEDGDTVKKGTKLVEFDDTALRDRANAQKVILAEKRALLEQAMKERDLVLAQTKLDTAAAEDNLELAELDLKDAAPEQKRKLEIRVRMAQRALEKAKLEAATRKDNAESAIAPRQAAVDAEAARLAELNEQLGHCTLFAPHDGMVVYHDTGRSVIGLSRDPITALGETVVEGQILMSVVVLNKMQLVANVHEASIHYVTPGPGGARPAMAQPAKVTIDAVPGKPINGQVQAVSAVPRASDWFSADVKRYPVTISLDFDNGAQRLKPGMSGTVAILVREQKDVLRLPVQAVRRFRGKATCLVKTETGVEERALILGEVSDTFAEIRDGVKEGEEVALNPQALRPAGAPAEPRREGRALPGPRDVLVHAVPPPESTGRQARLPRYGLTKADLEQFEQVVPGIESVLPIRFFPIDVRTPEKAARLGANLLAVTPPYAEARGLDDLLGSSRDRFLCDLDEDRLARVVVVGAKIAERLFPESDPVGQTLLIGSSGAFQIVGVLGPQPLSEPIDHDNDIYTPLPTCHRVFGERIVLRKPGSFRAEQVEINDALLTLRDRSQVAHAAAVVRALLEEKQPGAEWDIKTQ
jgi:multidrug efflux pump subunit AcrA (membrane-fusion protein)